MSGVDTSSGGQICQKDDRYIRYVRRSTDTSEGGQICQKE